MYLRRVSCQWQSIPQLRICEFVDISSVWHGRTTKRKNFHELVGITSAWVIGCTPCGRTFWQGSDLGRGKNPSDKSYGEPECQKAKCWEQFGYCESTVADADLLRANSSGRAGSETNSFLCYASTKLGSDSGNSGSGKESVCGEDGRDQLQKVDRHHTVKTPIP